MPESIIDNTAEAAGKDKDKDRQHITAQKVLCTVGFPFRPKWSRAFMELDKFEDLNVQELIQSGIRGLVIDVDGTLVEHGALEFSDGVVNKLREITRAGIKTCILSNMAADRYDQIEELGISIVTNVPPKPDPEAFRVAREDHLGIEEPALTAMVGDNRVTDGAGAIRAGMEYIYVKTRPSETETKAHSGFKSALNGIARTHQRVREFFGTQ